MKKLLLIGMVFCILLLQSSVAHARIHKLINKHFFDNTNYTNAYDPYEDISEKYSYNEKEEIKITPKYLKTKYDINMGEESQMSVGIKSFSFKFKY